MPFQPRYERATDGDDGRRRDAQDDADRGVAAEQLLHASAPYSQLEMVAGCSCRTAAGQFCWYCQPEAFRFGQYPLPHRVKNG